MTAAARRRRGIEPRPGLTPRPTRRAENRAKAHHTALVARGVCETIHFRQLSTLAHNALPGHDRLNRKEDSRHSDLGRRRLRVCGVGKGTRHVPVQDRSMSWKERGHRSSGLSIFSALRQIRADIYTPQISPILLCPLPSLPPTRPRPDPQSEFDTIKEGRRERGGRGRTRESLEI